MPPGPAEGRPASARPMDWNAGLYDAGYAFVWKQAEDLVGLLAPAPGERVLDLGCGTGHLTARISAAGAQATGLDNSPAMIERARLNYPGVTFVLGDAADFRFDAPFDGVFSNAALHWVGRPARALACVWRALRPGGRFVAEFGGKGNVGAIVGAFDDALRSLGVAGRPLASRWYFPSLGEYETLLLHHDFTLEYAAYFRRPTPLEGGSLGLRRWLELFAGDVLDGLPGALREQVIGRVEATLGPRLLRGGTWVADYRRIRVAAVKPVGP